MGITARSLTVCHSEPFAAAPRGENVSRNLLFLLPTRASPLILSERSEPGDFSFATKTTATRMDTFFSAPETP